MSKKILFLSPYPTGKAPSQRLKYEQYFTFLKERGFELHVSSFVSEPFWDILYQKDNYVKKMYYTFLGYTKRIFLLFKIARFDYVYIHLWATPFGFPCYERLVRVFAKKVIYDIDDMIFLGHSSDANKFFSGLKGRNKMIYLMKSADHVITCTPMLDDYVRKYNHSTTDISSTVDTLNRYIPVNTYQNNHIPVIGWSGSHSTSRYLHLLKGVLQSLARKHNFILRVMGDEHFFIEGVVVEAVPWKEVYEMQTLQSFDIGLYPLPDEEWVYGKSGLKAIQYMALGIPTIATAIGANFRIIENGVSGILIPPNDNAAWESSIEKLILDAKYREKLGLCGRKVIEQNFSVEANKHKYLAVFQSLDP